MESLTLWWALGTALCLALTYWLSAARGRGPRAVGLSAVLVPVTTLWLWALTVDIPPWIYFAGPYLFGWQNRTKAVWLGTLIVAAAVTFVVVAARRAAYAAAVAMLGFGFYTALLDAIVKTSGGTITWWNWFLFYATPPVTWVVAVLSLTAGFVLVRRTIVADMRARRSGLTARINTLTQTRADAVDSAAAELRRLERDLHDGTQARLVALGINLRAVEKLIRTSPDAAEALVAECRETSSRALQELRDLVRGIYPPVLADRGLADAICALALDCPVPVATGIDFSGRPPQPIESAVYFATAEILNNVAKHSSATHAVIRAGHTAGMLRVEVTDDGAGGADPAAGTGLAGIEQRLAAFDGVLAVHSPLGGPTIVIIEVPCALSSPKISIS